MVKVIGVRFRTAGKIYYFDPLNFQVKRGDHVIVETARGVEYGTVVGSPREVEDDKVVQPLKPVLRVATERDDEQEAAEGVFPAFQMTDGVHEERCARRKNDEAERQHREAAFFGGESFFFHEVPSLWGRKCFF